MTVVKFICTSAICWTYVKLLFLKMSYEKEEQALLALWAASEEEEEFVPAIDCDVSEEDGLSERSEHNTDSEQSDDEFFFKKRRDETTESWGSGLYFIGKDKVTKWMKHNDVFHSKTRSKNIVSKLPGVRPSAKNAKTYMDSWNLIFPNEIINIIVECTNLQLDIMRNKYQRERDCLPTDFEEVNAFLGILYMAGVKKAQHLSTNELWITDGTVGPKGNIWEKTSYLLYGLIEFHERPVNFLSKVKTFMEENTLILSSL